VAVSAVVALTLSPMMCSRFFKAEQDAGRFVRFIDGQFEWFHGHYLRVLRSSLATSRVTVVLGVLILLATGFLFASSKSELAPQEDQGFIMAALQGPPSATVQQMQTYSDQVFGIAKAIPEYQQMFQFTNAGSGFAGLILKPWDQRKRSAETVQTAFQVSCAGIAGATVATFQPPSLPGATGLPVQFVIKTTEPFDRLSEVAKAVLDKARASGMFFFVDTDLKIDKPQSTLVLDRDLVATLGLTLQDVGGAMGGALGGGYVNYFSIGGRSYRVIPQVLQVDRLNPGQVLDYQVRTTDGTMLPVSTLATLKNTVVPQSINRFQQLNSATISGVYGPSFSQEQVLDFFRKALREAAPPGYQADYSGVSRQFMQEAGGFLVTLVFAIIIVFLALAAQFNSLRDPLIILVSVPMALFGAMIFINLGVATLNIYTQVGLVTLMGLISKHGILIVQFANELQAEGHSRLEAITEAAAIRLRPILMTTAAMVLGVFPLVIAGGAGAAGRRAMGLVIFTGLSIGTVFTLFVVPAFYNLFAARRKA